jgi:hypothetical protein
MYGAVAKERVTFRFAKAEDIDAYYGSRPAQTLRAIVIQLDGRVTGLIGVARHVDHARFFSEFREELRPHLRALPVMRAIKRAQGLIRESPLPVYAIAEETETDSVRILTRLGFVHYQENIYTWPNSRSLSPTS